MGEHGLVDGVVETHPPGQRRRVLGEEVLVQRPLERHVVLKALGQATAGGAEGADGGHRVAHAHEEASPGQAVEVAPEARVLHGQEALSLEIHVRRGVAVSHPGGATLFPECPEVQPPAREGPGGRHLLPERGEKLMGREAQTVPRLHDRDTCRRLEEHGCEQGGACARRPQMTTSSGPTGGSGSGWASRSRVQRAKMAAQRRWRGDTLATTGPTTRRTVEDISTPPSSSPSVVLRTPLTMSAGRTPASPPTSRRSGRGSVLALRPSSAGGARPASSPATPTLRPGRDPSEESERT